MAQIGQGPKKMKQIAAWLGVILMVLAGYFAFWPIPIAPLAWSVTPAPGYVGPHAQNKRLAGLQTIDIGFIAFM